MNTAIRNPDRSFGPVRQPLYGVKVSSLGNTQHYHRETIVIRTLVRKEVHNKESQWYKLIMFHLWTPGEPKELFLDGLLPIYSFKFSL